MKISSDSPEISASSSSTSLSTSTSSLLNQRRQATVSLESSSPSSSSTRRSSYSSSLSTSASWRISRLSSFLAIALLLSILAPSLLVKAHTIDVAPNTKECFFEDLSAEDKMTATYQVAAGGELDIDFWVTNPRGDTMYKLNKMDTGTYSFTAHLDGRYTYCFSNMMSSVTGKTVSFNVHGVMYVEDDGHTAPIEKEIRALSAALEAVKDEQEYIVTRERLHRDTAESTNDRVKWWSIIQTVLLIAVCAWQVYYLRRFFEVKR